MELIEQIQKSLAEIKEQTSLLESNMANISEYIKSEQFIPNDIITEAISNLESVCSRNEFCKEQFTVLSGKSIELDKISEFENELEISKNGAYFEDTVNYACRFKFLHSDDKTVEALLDIEKNKLKEILAQGLDDNVLVKKLEPYISLLKTIETNLPSNDPMLISHIVELNQYFNNSLVMHATLTRDIILSEQEEPADEHIPEAALDISEQDNPADTDFSNTQLEIHTEDIAAETNEAVSSLNTNTESTVYDSSDEASDENSNEDIKSEKKQESKLVKKLIEADALIPEDFAYGELIVNSSQRESKKFGVKDFKSDIRMGNERIKKLIIKTIHTLNSINDNFLATITNKPINVINQETDYLIRKGYLRKYIINDMGSFYCITDKCEKAFESKDACSFLDVQFKHKNQGSENVEDRASSAMARIVYTKILEYFSEHFDEYPFTFNMYSEAFIISLIIEGVNNLFIGCFWGHTDECDKFIGDIADFMSKDEDNRIIYVGFDKSYISAAAKIIDELITDNASKKYIYALQENELCQFDDLSPVDIDTISHKDTALIYADEVVDETIDEVIDGVANESADGAIDGAGNVSSDKCDNIDNGDNIGITAVMPVLENSTPAPVTVQMAESVPSVPVKDEILNNVYRMIINNRTYCASAYLKALDKGEEIGKIYTLFAYSINDPICKCSYISDKIFDILPERHSDFNDFLVISIVLRTFFYNHVGYDYMLKSLYDTIKEYPIVSNNSELSMLIYEIMNFKHTYNKGLDAYADYRAKDKAALEKTLENLQLEAQKYYETVVLSPITEKTGHKRFIETKKIIFNPNNYIALYLKSIIDKDYSLIPIMKDFLAETFIKNESTVTYVNIDNEKLNIFMDENWKMAGEKMRFNKKTSDLMSRLRSNLDNSIRKALKIMCDWVEYTKNRDEEVNDHAAAHYKEIKKPLLDKFDKALKETENIKNNNVGSKDVIAGTIILSDTLMELKNRVNGSYSDNAELFFYIDFLRSDNILLNDEYLPDFGYESLADTEISAANRILEHAEKEPPSFEDRMYEIFMNKGDDYGSAKLIDDYYTAINNRSLIHEQNYDLAESIEFARREAEDSKNKFIEDLELAQSYGQIENSIDNKKEIILHIVSEWFDYANLTYNFGFFRKVTDYFLRKIKEDAKIREEQLNKELSNLKSSVVTEDQKQKVEKIQEMISIQNYTVAEDLIRRYNKDEPETDFEIFSKDYLKDFIDNYDMYARTVSDGSRSFKMLVSNKGHNKDVRGAQRLADNWMINGNKISSENLKLFLIALGFSVAEVNEQSRIENINNYIVKLKRPDNGRKTNFKHPIAAFGSMAVEDGFRVVLLFGKYDADRLIDVIKSLGNAKHTIILLDHAITLSERRRLARKIKKPDMPNKIFGVIDRVLLHYLMRCYNETSINRILMSLMMPFAYNQLYVSDSSKVMPPEIFMGRKNELESIENPEGVNIVYGGRQLGKSALLKMAKNDIDKNENGDRAILIDIKGLDYKSAARKISNALFDEGILDEDLNTGDWNLLSRTIRNRLAKNIPCRIPYLLLLLDEADAFIESCESVNYAPFDALKEIQSIGTDRFKFVIAGLRNVIRFKRDTVLSNNIVLTHFESMTVKPFDYSEGRELIEIPLYYLGLRFPKEKESLISLILASANYFPGLIQLYCAKLIEAMRIGYAGYDQDNTPEYIVQEKHIKKVLADSTFTEQIREKFEITLKLDDDNYYYIIALIIAYLYHFKYHNEGCSPEDIYSVGQEFEISKITELRTDKLTALLEELCELNILRKTSNEKYLFSRYSFFEMMGSAQQVENKLYEFIGD